jgi:hypothetical protein
MRWLIQGSSTRFTSLTVGDVTLDVSSLEASLELRWLNIDNAIWQYSQQMDNEGSLALQPPGDGHWVVVISRFH